jgi:hypothetical protein
MFGRRGRGERQGDNRQLWGQALPERALTTLGRGSGQPTLRTLRRALRKRGRGHGSKRSKEITLFGTVELHKRALQR